MAVNKAIVTYILLLGPALCFDIEILDSDLDMVSPQCRTDLLKIEESLNSTGVFRGSSDFWARKCKKKLLKSTH